MDWRIGRLIRTVPRQFVTGAAIDSIIPASNQRIAISISFYDTDLALQPVMTVLDVSGTFFYFVQGANQVPLHLTLATHGDLPTKSLRVQTNGSVAALLAVTEYFAPEEYLAAALEQFRTEYGMKGF